MGVRFEAEHKLPHSRQGQSCRHLQALQHSTKPEKQNLPCPWFHCLARGPRLKNRLEKDLKVKRVSQEIEVQQLSHSDQQCPSCWAIASATRDWSNWASFALSSQEWWICFAQSATTDRPHQWWWHWHEWLRTSWMTAHDHGLRYNFGIHCVFN